MKVLAILLSLLLQSSLTPAMTNSRPVHAEAGSLTTVGPALPGFGCQSLVISARLDAPSFDPLAQHQEDHAMFNNGSSQVGEVPIASVDPATAGDGPHRYPAAWRQHESCGGGEPALDLHEAATGTSHQVSQSAALAAIGPEAAPIIMGAKHLSQQQSGGGEVLKVGSQDHEPQQAQRVHHDVALTALSLLASIAAARSDGLAVLGALAIERALSRLAPPPGLKPKAFARVRVNVFEQAIGQPASGVCATALRRHAASWQVAPLSTTAQRVAGGVGHFTSGVIQLGSDCSWFRKAVGYESSFWKGKVMCVAHQRGVGSSISWDRLLTGAGVGVFKQALSAPYILLAQAGQSLPIDAFLDFLSKITLTCGVVAVFWGGWKITRGEVGEGVMAIVGGFIMIIAIPIARHLMGL